MDTYTITGFWEDGIETSDYGMTKEEIVTIVDDVLGDGCTGFEIRLGEF